MDRRSFAMVAVALVVSAAVVSVPMASEESDAVVLNYSKELTVVVGEYFTLTTSVNTSSGNIMSGMTNPPDWVDYSAKSGSQTISGTAPVAGDYSFTVCSGTAAKNAKVAYTIHAVNPDHTESLHFNANGGTGAPGTLTSTTNVTTATSFTIPSTVPTRSGYTFLGWSASSNATVAQYQPGSQVGVDHNSSVTLYAVWKLDATMHILQFDANGGSGAPSKQSVQVAGTYSMAIPSTVPTRSGYTFLGWSASSIASSAQYQPGSSISVADNQVLTLYAVWKLDAPTIGGTPTTSTVQYSPWSYKPTVTGLDVDVTVSGASWLSVANGTVVGTPTAIGTYNVTVTATNGAGSDTQSFQVVVLSKLSFQSLPQGGALIYASK